MSADVKKSSPINVVNKINNYQTPDTTNEYQAAQLREIESLKKRLDDESNKNVKLNMELLQFKTSNYSNNILSNDKNGESFSSPLNGKRTTTDAVSRNHLNTNLIDEYSEIKFQIEQMENGIDDYFE